MVTIINFEKHQGTDKEFLLLQLQGDVEAAISQTTGLPYLTARRCSIPSTFDEVTCKALIGKQLPGSIIKIKVEEPYEFTIPETKEIITLDYRYVYSTQENNNMETAVFEEAVLV